ncbi:3-phosphoshikimate 1-carboxyvinyltransferase [Actinomycetota bacterium]|nr:3-phosphoshikimate 1-carboxyvinyltransferase [Actinomycetota bacterium]
MYNAPFLDDNGRVDAVVKIPGSKSLTNRFLVLQALSKNPQPINNALVSRDTELMRRALNCVIQNGDFSAQVHADRLRLSAAHAQTRERVPKVSAARLTLRESILDDTVQSANTVKLINTGLAGTVMRFVPFVAALECGRFRFDGDEQARVRPMGPILDGLEQLGVSMVRENGEFMPFVVQGTGRIEGGEVKIDASSSSQFVSALLLCGAKFTKGLHLIHTGTKVPSMPHIDMTIECLKLAGVKAKRVDDKFEWIVEPGEINLPAIDVEPDLSNAGPFLCAALANPAGGQISIPNWPKTTTQPGQYFPAILEQMGAVVQNVPYRSQLQGTLDPNSRSRLSPQHFSLEETASLAEKNFGGFPSVDFDMGHFGQLTDDGGNAMTIRSDGKIKGVELDLSAAGEIAPTVAALCALAEGPSKLTGIGHLRGHETDRLQAIVNEIGKLGRSARIADDGDGIEIDEMPSTGLIPTTIDSYNDHRMATFGAIIGLRAHGCKVVNIETVGKTMPDFVQMWEGMLG